MKVMISQPMPGIEVEEQRKAREKAKSILENAGHYVLDTIWYKPSHISEDKMDLHYLSQAIETMANCDAIYLVEGWERSRGCNLERIIALQHNIRLLTSADF